MQWPESSIENLNGLGYTEDEARFLYLVATHSGYFSTRQFLSFTHAKSGEKSMSFTQKVLGKGHATARLLLRNGRVYHLYSRLVYRAIGRENLRNRREHSVEHIRTKLTILDFVLAHLDYRFLETEGDKVSYFCKELGLKTSALPAKSYAGAIREKTTDRYFVDKFPMFFVPESSSSPVVTFSFVDPGLLSLASFETHLLAYGDLFSNVPQVNFVYIATRPTHFEAARQLFLAMAPRSMNPDPGVEGLRYFHYRHLWESNQCSKLNRDQIEFLNEATKRFTDARTESLYLPWLEGQITVDVVTEAFRRLAPKREVAFRTELVDGQAALFEANLLRRSRNKRVTEVTGRSESTFGPVFRPVFGEQSQQPQENKHDARREDNKSARGQNHGNAGSDPALDGFQPPKVPGGRSRRHGSLACRCFGRVQEAEQTSCNAVCDATRITKGEKTLGTFESTVEATKEHDPPGPLGKRRKA